MRSINLSRLQYWPSRFRVLSTVLLLAFGLATAAVGQAHEETLPSSALFDPGNLSTSYPFNTTNDSSVLMVYEYNTEPVRINEIYFRAQGSGSGLANFSFSDVEVTLFHACEDFDNLQSTYADNIQSGVVVRTGSYSKNFSVAENSVSGRSGWIPLKLQKGFSYDPNRGQLGVLIRVCGVNTPWGLGIDGAGGINAGRRFNTSNCTAPQGSSSNDNFCPVIKIDRAVISQTTVPAGQIGSNSNGATNFVVNTALDQTWQWHYDSTEFSFPADHAITISDIAVRANNAFADVPAFDFSDFEVTLIEASTDYGAGSHSSTFANNIIRQKVVRTGNWSAPVTKKTNGPSSEWISFQLVDTFDYDPRTGNDLIVQIRVCGPNVLWGQSMDSVVGPPTSVGGNSYGNLASCAATSSDIGGSESVPVLLVSYKRRLLGSYYENFDHWGSTTSRGNPPFGWIQDSGNSSDWRFHNSDTSVGTAPADFTTGLPGQGRYMTTDDSFGTGVERIETPIFDYPVLPNIYASFWIYSNSTRSAQDLDENAFTVDVKRYNAGGGTTIFTNQIPTVRVLRHGCWTKYALDLTSFGGTEFSLVFEGTTDSSNGYFHDFAIDDFNISFGFTDENGQAARPMSSLNINECYNKNGFHVDSNAPGPYYACGKPLGEFNVRIRSGAVGQPTALWIGPLNIGVASFGAAGQIDTGTPDTSGDGIPESIFVLGSGLNMPPSFLDLFFFTNAAGNTDISFPLNPGLPFGTLGTFQGATTDGLGGIFVTNAVVFEIVP